MEIEASLRAAHPRPAPAGRPARPGGGRPLAPGTRAADRQVVVLADALHDQELARPAVLAMDEVRGLRALGIRMALGARTGQALGLVLRHGLASALIGLGVGTVTAAGLARYMSSLLYEVEPSDPRAFLGAAAMLLAVALLAAWLPALRATRVDPAETLRVE